jgi:hypothetical protein
VFRGGEANFVRSGDGAVGARVASVEVGAVADGGGVLPTCCACSYCSASIPIVRDSKPRLSPILSPWPSQVDDVHSLKIVSLDTMVHRDTGSKKLHALAFHM